MNFGHPSLNTVEINVENKTFANLLQLSGLLGLNAILALVTSGCYDDDFNVGTVELNAQGIHLETPDHTPYTGTAQLCFKVGTKGAHGDDISYHLKQCQNVKIDQNEVQS